MPVLILRKSRDAIMKGVPMPISGGGPHDCSITLVDCCNGSLPSLVIIATRIVSTPDQK